MKLTPARWLARVHVLWQYGMRTQSLNVVFVPAALDILDHQGGLADLRITDHSNLDDDASILLGLLPLGILVAVVAVLTVQARARSRGVLWHLVFVLLLLWVGGVVLRLVVGCKASVGVGGLRAASGIGRVGDVVVVDMGESVDR